MIKHSKLPNKYSLKKIAQINGEKNTRIALCKRAGGKPIIYKQLYKRNDGTQYVITRVKCVGGICECKQKDCPKIANAINGQLEPHELLSRGRGGKLTSQNSIMVLRNCHRKLDGRNPKLEWLK